MSAATKSVCVMLFSAALLGCGGVPYQDPGQRLAMLSLEEVATLVRQTRAYLASGKTEAEAVEEAKRAAASKLKDPEAARFRNVVIKSYIDGKIICGELNGKNSYGAYVGYRPFAASPMDAVLQSTGSRYASTDELANTGLRNACG